MKLIAQVKLLPTPQQVDALKRTLERANAASQRVSDYAWETKTFRQYDLHRALYYDVKEHFGLTAQVVVRLLAKVADAYKLDRKHKRTFKPTGAISYDDRILHWYESKVSIWTVDGRQRIPFVCGERQRVLLQSRQGESDLLTFDGMFFLSATCEVQEPDLKDVNEFLGVDMGIKSIASDSDGTQYAGGHVNGLRHRHARLRAKLQRKGTKAAKHLLKKRSRKESRHAKHVNHCIAKELVARAKGTGRGIALEDLTGIRDRVTVRKAQRRQHSSWAFYDLRVKIAYKARLAGVSVAFVDPRNTSRTCPMCGCIDKRNRLTQSQFLCVSCGHSSNADTNAAVIISRRAAIDRPYVSDTVATSP